MADETGQCGMPRLVSVPEAAELLRMSEKQIRRWLGSGQLPKRQPGGRGTKVFVLVDDLLRITDEPTVNTDETEDD